MASLHLDGGACTRPSPACPPAHARTHAPTHQPTHLLPCFYLYRYVAPGSPCSPPSVPCTNHSTCSDYCDTCNPHVCPADQSCPARPWPGGFVPWVRAVSKSNVFGIRAGVDVPGIPFLGVFPQEVGCQQACEASPNCTQYSWSGNTAGFHNMCYGR